MCHFDSWKNLPGHGRGSSSIGSSWCLHHYRKGINRRVQLEGRPHHPHCPVQSSSTLHPYLQGWWTWWGCHLSKWPWIGNMTRGPQQWLRTIVSMLRATWSRHVKEDLESLRQGGYDNHTYRGRIKAENQIRLVWLWLNQCIQHMIWVEEVWEIGF